MINAIKEWWAKLRHPVAVIDDEEKVTYVYHKLNTEAWIEVLLQLVASGEVTQERLYTKLSDSQKKELEAYVISKRML